VTGGEPGVGGDTRDRYEVRGGEPADFVFCVARAGLRGDGGEDVIEVNMALQGVIIGGRVVRRLRRPGGR
jgi:hypothetical protein